MVVRSFGLLISLVGAWYFLFGLNALLGIAPEDSPGEWRQFLPAGAWMIIIGGVLMYCADGVVNSCY